MNILSDSVEQIIQALKNKRWDDQLYDGMVEVAEINPAKILQLLKTGINALPAGVTLINDLISYARLADLSELAVAHSSYLAFRS